MYIPMYTYTYTLGSCGPACFLGVCSRNQWLRFRNHLQDPHGFVWKCWVYSQWNSHLIGIMISKTIGFRGTLFSDTPIFCSIFLFWTTSQMRSKPTFCRLAITCYHFLSRNSSAQKKRSVPLRMESTSVNSVNPTASDASAQTWAIRPFFLSSPGVEASRCSSYIFGTQNRWWFSMVFGHDQAWSSCVGSHKPVQRSQCWDKLRRHFCFEKFVSYPNHAQK